MEKLAILLEMTEPAATKPISQQSTQILSTMLAGKIWHVVKYLFLLTPNAQIRFNL